MKEKTALPVIECSGTEYEIGRQYGAQARESLQSAAGLMYRSMELMPYQAGREAVSRAGRRYLENVRSFDPGALERVKGMAEGSGVPFDDVFALQCYSELFVNYPGIVGMCTSFAVAGKAVKDGKTILGQNVDWHPDSTIDLVRIRRRDGSRMFCLFLNGCGSFYLSSHGFGNCANLTICPPAVVSGHIPFGFYGYHAMSRQGAREALEVLRRTARGVGYIHVAGRDGFMAGIESVYDDCTVMEPRDDVLVHANHYETEKYREGDAARAYIPHSFTRAERLRTLIAGAHGSLTPQMLMTFLEDHEGRPNSLCRHVDPAVPAVFASLSRASWVAVPAEGRIFIADGPPCGKEYAEYVL